MLKKITLAIETAVGNGSLSLFENDLLLDQQNGEEKISRSDYFLPVLDRFLERNDVNKSDLSLIAVSRGPGSFTGARVGLATAVALKNGLAVPCLGVSVLRAAALSNLQLNKSKPKKVISAFVNEKNQVIWEDFDDCADFGLTQITETDKPNFLRGNGVKIHNIEQFLSHINNQINSKWKWLASENQIEIFAENSLFLLIKEKNTENLKSPLNYLPVKNTGINLSLFVGSATLKGYASDNLSVVYYNQI